MYLTDELSRTLIATNAIRETYPYSTNLWRESFGSTEILASFSKTSYDSLRKTHRICFRSHCALRPTDFRDSFELFGVIGPLLETSNEITANVIRETNEITAIVIRETNARNPGRRLSNSLETSLISAETLTNFLEFRYFCSPRNASTPRNGLLFDSKTNDKRCRKINEPQHVHDYCKPPKIRHEEKVYILNSNKPPGI